MPGFGKGKPRTLAPRQHSGLCCCPLSPTVVRKDRGIRKAFPCIPARVCGWPPPCSSMWCQFYVGQSPGDAQVTATTGRLTNGGPQGSDGTSGTTEGRGITESWGARGWGSWYVMVTHSPSLGFPSSLTWGHVQGWLPGVWPGRSLGRAPRLASSSALSILKSLKQGPCVFILLWPLETMLPRLGTGLSTSPSLTPGISKSPGASVASLDSKLATL